MFAGQGSGQSPGHGQGSGCLLKFTMVSVFPQVIRMTGFMKGLYTDAEMKSDNVKVGCAASLEQALNE